MFPRRFGGSPTKFVETPPIQAKPALVTGRRRMLKDTPRRAWWRMRHWHRFTRSGVLGLRVFGGLTADIPT